MEYLKHARPKSDKERFNTNFFEKTQNQNKTKQFENGREMRLLQLPYFIDIRSFNFMEYLKHARSKQLELIM
jgi:hypothetical protein